MVGTNAALKLYYLPWNNCQKNIRTIIIACSHVQKHANHMHNLFCKLTWQ